jgi:hypothetical protein
MTDEDGVLANLPRSRSGRRSSKRAPATPQQAARPDPPPAARPAAGARRAAGAAAERQPPITPESDSVGDAIRTATGVAAAGARLANGMAREVLRRLPRP